MRIRVIAPVTNQALKATTPSIYVQKARPDVKISVVNLGKGPESIESLYEDAIAVPQVIRRAIEAERDGVDAVIIDCMNDPGLEATREVVSIPVVGAAQSSMLLASILAHKFSVIGTAARDVFPAELLIRRYGLEAKYASTRWVNIPVLDLHEDHEKLLAALVEESTKAVLQDGAHAIVFGCTGMKGMAAMVEKKLKENGLDAIVIDPSLAALKWAELLVDLHLVHSRQTYPLVKEKLLDEHRISTSTPVPEISGQLDHAANIYVLVPVVQGYREDNWLESTRRDYASYSRKGSTVRAVAIESGPATIETLYFKQIAVPEMLRLTRSAQQNGADGVIIDCMSDPSLDSAREVASIPVIGPAQAAAFVAASLAHRFSILGTRSDMGHKFVNQMVEYGIASKLASVRTTGLSVQEVETDPDVMFKALSQAAEQAVLQDGAHILIPGCTGMIGIADRLQNALQAKGMDVPVIEAPAVAVKMIEALSDLGLAQSKITYPMPPKKALAGYPDLEV